MSECFRTCRGWVVIIYCTYQVKFCVSVLVFSRSPRCTLITSWSSEHNSVILTQKLILFRTVQHIIIDIVLIILQREVNFTLEMFFCKYIVFFSNTLFNCSAFLIKHNNNKCISRSYAIIILYYKYYYYYYY